MASEPDPILDSRVVGDGTPNPAPPLTPFAGLVAGRYRLLDQVGSGGFSLVWRAERVDTGTVVALKLPRVPEFIDHLRREARIATRFQDPQVVGIIETCLENDPPFLAMPFIPGSNLQLPDRPPEPKDILPALRRFRRIAEVVARLHDAGVVHGDLKPGNLRFDPADVCHVLDLGLARIQVNTRQNTTLRASVVSVTGEKIAGTLEYMAPEVMSGDKPGTAADVFALGVLLHTALCGRPPAFGVSPTELNPYLPPGAPDLLRQALHQDPLKRLPAAGALLPAVDGFIRAEERCLRRRNGHARRLVFHRRMSILARGIKGLTLLGTLGLLLVVAVPALARLRLQPGTVLLLAVPIGFAAGAVALLGVLLAMTTLNAWMMGVPEKTYKNRSGHPWWTFMMR
jgi:serine/threonine protein kinase